MSAGLRDALTEALTVAASDPSIAAVRLTGAGRSFSSGGDLDEFGSFPDPATAHVTRLTRSPARLAHLLGDRLEVHLHGACMGAGIELPAFARHVVAAQDVAIALPEVGLGLIPGAGGTVSLPPADRAPAHGAPRPVRAHDRRGDGAGVGSGGRGGLSAPPDQCGSSSTAHSRATAAVKPCSGGVP